MEAGLRTKKVTREINIEDEMEVKDAQKEKMAHADGFIAALDQSGGSTPKALGLYGVSEDAWSTEEEMFDLVHAMRTRIITSPAFNGDRILAAILFENTMKNTVEGLPTAEYLWSKKQVVPILKIDKGLAEESNGVQMMKPMPDLGNTLSSANEHGIFGTKMRSVIKEHSTNGIHDVVKQQFEVGAEILSAGLVPIIEPEVDINCPDKTGAETFLKECIISSLDDLREGQEVMLKLTLPEEDGLYQACVAHPRTLRVVALSGGYSREESNLRLAKQLGMVASFSRALTEGLQASQTEEAFNQLLDSSIAEICAASKT
jgi:fructose-bisphosphate aldolase class I